MKQSRRMSLVEAVANVVVGYAVAVLTQILVFPFFGLQTSLSENLAIGLRLHHRLHWPFLHTTAIVRGDPRLLIFGDDWTPTTLPDRGGLLATLQPFLKRNAITLASR